MEQSDSDFKKDARLKINGYCWTTNSSGAEKMLEESLIKEFFNKMDKHQKRKLKMLCEIFAHKADPYC